MTIAHVTSPTHIGKPVSRYEGMDKVTGRARYAADFAAPGMAHAVVVSADIALGRVTQLLTAEAERLPGVIAILSHLNCPDVAKGDKAYQDQVSPPGSPFRPFRDERVMFDGQPIALVVAEDFETARHAARLIHVVYEQDTANTDMSAVLGIAYKPPKKRFGMNGVPGRRGDTQDALRVAHPRVDAHFETPPAYHHPMEMHATTAIWISDTKIHVHDKTQGAQNSRNYIAAIFGYSKDDVIVEAPYIGGAFGSGLRPQYQLFLAVLAARELKRPVQLMLTRQQMFSFGHRPQTHQNISLGATGEGLMTSIFHEVVAATSTYEDYQEDVVHWAELLYATENASYAYALTKLDIATPSDMRAPGGGLGMFAIESAIDELAEASSMDPVGFRLQNYSERDQFEDRPFSTKELRRCFSEGAAAFDWQHRQAGGHSDGHVRLGMGMATGIWEANILPTNALARRQSDGRIEIETAMADIGTGTYTICQQVAADVLGVSLDMVSVRLGDSRLANAPVEGGSFGAASVTAAVEAACKALKNKLESSARDIGKHANAPIEAEGGSDPYYFKTAKALLGLKSHSTYSHSAVFAEVAVEPELAAIHVRRIVIAVDAGRILNPKTARSQIIGGATWGLSMALHEEALRDHTSGRIVNRSLGEYHFPVCADIPDIKVIFIETPDTKLNPLGVKGLGEIGLVGTAAAIANAIYNAVGVRMRKLPITSERLFEGLVQNERHKTIGSALPLKGASA